MKLTVKELKKLIREQVEEEMSSVLPDIVKGLRVIKTHTESKPMEFDTGAERRYYDIIDKNGDTVGSLEYGTYFGDVTGELFGRHLPDLSDYGPSQSGPAGKLIRFFKTKTGRKWLDVSIRRGLK